MPYIVEFKEWKKRIFEQNSGEAMPIDFVVFAGTDKTNINDKRLNQEHGYPLSKNGVDNTSIYELELTQAIYGEFESAKIVGKTENEGRDFLTFDGKKISETGIIELLWTTENMHKPIRVSGNGALALARIAQAIANEGSVTKEQVGTVVISLGEEKHAVGEGRYSKFFSILKSGLTEQDLMASANSLVRSALRAICNDETKKALDVSPNSDFSKLFSNTAPFGIKEKDAAGTTIKKYPNRKANQVLNAYYGKYSSTDLVNKGRHTKTLTTIAGTIKSSYIDPGFDSLSAYILAYFKSEFSEVPESIIQRLTKKIQVNISSIKQKYSVNMAATSMAKAFKKSTYIKTIPNSQELKKNTTTYDPGK